MRHFCKLSDSDVERVWHGRGDELHLGECRPSPAESRQILELDLDTLGLLSPVWCCTVVVSPPKVPQGCWEDFWKVFETPSKKSTVKMQALLRENIFHYECMYWIKFFLVNFLLLFHSEHSCHTPFCILPQHIHNEWKNIKISLISLFPYTL